MMFPNISIIKYFVLHIQNFKPTQLSRQVLTFFLLSKSVLLLHRTISIKMSYPTLKKNLKAKLPYLILDWFTNQYFFLLFFHKGYVKTSLFSSIFHHGYTDACNFV